MAPVVARACGMEVSLTGGGGSDFHGSLSAETAEPGVGLVQIRISAEEAARPPAFLLSWSYPTATVHGYWHPGSVHDKGLDVSWSAGFRSKATSSAPVGCLFGPDGSNRLTFALSDALNTVSVRAGVEEETARVVCSVGLFETPVAPFSEYGATLRFDAREGPYHEAIAGVGRWWAEMPDYEPASVPETARLPMYSTWYGFHQDLDPARVEEQCRMAKEVGCEAVIVDDGWQTAGSERGYAHTGDWRPAVEKMPDMAAHVGRVHGLGMRYLLWYSVPFVGYGSGAFARFENRLLGRIDRLSAGVLDPRFPEVREYLIGTYEAAVRDWDLDGLKLDFVDAFEPQPGQTPELGGGRDHDGVPEAVDRLLTDTMVRLRAVNPDVMIEFRQSYVGPLMRKYGNMFRAGDCPNDAVENRVRTLDLRLLCGDTAVHGDMLMWHPDESVESAALQLVNVLFGVPQISVMLDGIPPQHVEMLRFWLGLWREHRDVLLDGEIAPLHPDVLYPVVLARTAEKLAAAAYTDAVVRLEGELPATLLVVNGTPKDGVVLRLGHDGGERGIEVRDCRGRLVRAGRIELGVGPHELDVPAAGVAVVRL